MLRRDTQAGVLQVVAVPAGTRGGWNDLRRHASRESLGGGLRVPVASQDDLVRMSAALNREQEVAVRSQLRRLVELEPGRDLGLCPEITGVKLSLGATDRVLERTARLLAPALAEIDGAIRTAAAVNVDETSWAQAGAGRWIWTAATPTLMRIRISESRSQAACAGLTCRWIWCRRRRSRCRCWMRRRC